MTERTANFLHFLLAFAIASAFILIVDRKWRNTTPQTVIKTEVDTLYIRDTLRVSTPVYVRVRVVDSIFVPVTVTEVRDSLVYIPVPIEQKIYQDSSYRAVVSGPAFPERGPQLDTIDVFRKTTVVTRTNYVRVEPSRWSWGVQAGVGYGAGGVSPWVGVGIQYRIGYFEFKK